MKVELGKISSIKQGVVLNRVKSREGKEGILYPILTIGRLLQEEEGIYETEQNMISVCPSKVSCLKFAKAGMILIGLTSFHKAVVLTKEQEGMIIPSNFLILDFLGGIMDAHYFAWYFNESSSIRSLKENIIHGDGKVKVLSIQEIRGMEIEFPDLVSQMVIGNLYGLQLKKTRVWKQIFRLEMESLTHAIEKQGKFEKNEDILSILYSRLDDIRNQIEIYKEELAKTED